MTDDSADPEPESELVTTSRARSMASALWSGLSAGILGMLVIVAILVIVVPLVAGASAFTISGRSMEPSLPLGTLIVTHPVDPDEIRVGDVITFQMESGNPTVATHRVVGFEFQDERRFITQGDANNAVDIGSVQSEQIRGRLWYSIPLLGWVNAAISGPLRATMLPIVVVVLFGYATWMLVGAFRERAQRPEDGASGAGQDA